MKIKCPKCDHRWRTKSKLKFVTCPSCQLKVLNEAEQEARRID